MVDGSSYITDQQRETFVSSGWMWTRLHTAVWPVALNLITYGSVFSPQDSVGNRPGDRYSIFYYHCIGPVVQISNSGLCCCDIECVIIWCVPCM